MPRVHHVEKARKDNPVAKAGESYYWWKFRFGPKHYSKTRPRRSQLTQSSFLSTIYDIEDTMPSEMEESDAQDLVQQLEELRDECQGSLDNMPDSLQDSDTGQLLQDRISGLEEWIDAINSVDFDSLTPEEAADEITSANPSTW